MTQFNLATNPEMSEEDRLKRRLMTFTHIERSELPYRVEKSSTGVVLGRFETQEALIDFVDRYPLERLKSLPTRRRHSR